jgi:hypothetical protein
MVTGTIKPQGEKLKTITQFALVKNFVGGMAVTLEAYDFSAPARTIHFNFNQEKMYLPAKWALGVFVTPSALQQMEKGYFTFENLDALIQMAEELGYYVPDSIREPKVTIKEIAKALRSSDMEFLKKITLNLSNKLKSDLTSTAQSMYSSLNQSVIEFLEKQLKVSLKPVDLSE